jgi:cell division protein FtsI (penicillin-binding protein 3)
VNDAFEPGSTFKLVTAAMALEAGAVNLDTPVDCRGGRAVYAGRVVRDHGDDHMHVVPFREVIAQSSNVGTVEVAAKLGPDKLYSGIQRFGFGRPTGVDLPGEAGGMVRPVKDWSGASMASIPYGQELSCNVLHIARLYAAIGNGGRLVTPHVLREIQSYTGGSRSVEQGTAGEKIISPQVVANLVELLEGVVEKGTGSTTALPGFRVAGKTGTAQKFNMRTRSYNMQDTVSSFVGFVPAEHPQFVCAVVLDEPKGMTLGGWVAGPVFRASMSAMLAARGVVPDEKLIVAARDQPVTKSTRWTAGLRKGQTSIPVEWVKVPDLEGKDLASAKALLAQAGLSGIFSGTGNLVKSQFPKRSEKVRQFSSVKVLLDTVKLAEVPAKPKAGLP